jgi:hypothetical protein
VVGCRRADHLGDILWVIGVRAYLCDTIGWCGWTFSDSSGRMYLEMAGQIGILHASLCLYNDLLKLPTV